MHWILQDNLFNEAAYQNLLDTLTRFNISHSIHKVIPFIGEITPEPELDTHNVICMGSYSLRHAAKKNGWYPGVFDLEPYDFNVQLKHWGTEMLNHDAVVSRFQDAVFTEDEMFIRPIQDSKVFSGTLMFKDEFEQWQQKVCILEFDYGNSLSKDTLIQVVKPKKIYAEYRFWIVDQKVVTASLYKRGNKVMYSQDVDRHVYDYVHTILNTKDQKQNILADTVNRGWSPHDAWVLDVCETPDGMKVVEINTLNSCGFYAANMTDLVLTLDQKFTRKK